MSIELVFEWRRGYQPELIHLGPHALFKDIWAPLAAEIGLEMIPKFYAFFPIHPDNLEPLLDELSAFRAELIRRGMEPHLEYVDLITTNLQVFKGRDDWSASIG